MHGSSKAIYHGPCAVSFYHPFSENRRMYTDQNAGHTCIKGAWYSFGQYLCGRELFFGRFSMHLVATQEEFFNLSHCQLVTLISRDELNAQLQSLDWDPQCKDYLSQIFQDLTLHKPTKFTQNISEKRPVAAGCPYVDKTEGRMEDNGSHEHCPLRSWWFGQRRRLCIYQLNFMEIYCVNASVHWGITYLPVLFLTHSTAFLITTNFVFTGVGPSSPRKLAASLLTLCFVLNWTLVNISLLSQNYPVQKILANKGIKMRRKFTHWPLHWNGDNSTMCLLLRSWWVGNPEKKYPESESALSVLDKKEGEQAKALFEKVKKFRTHVEEADILYVMYVLQTSLKVIKFLAIIIYTSVLVANIEIVVRCYVPPELTGFDIYCCNHNKAHLFSKLSYCYIFFVGVYGFLCIYTLYWLFHRPLKEYSFEHVRLEAGISDIPDVKNDFAFLLHLADQYDALYSKRFAVFLSEVSESRLHQLNLNYEWTPKKLRNSLTKNTKNQLELHLLMLPGLPDTVFEIHELESLKLEQIKNVTIPPSVAKLECLQELSLIYCPAKLQLPALKHLKEHLKVLRLSFESLEEVPLWMYTLHGLEELHMNGPLTNEVSRNATLDSLRELRALRVLTLRSNLTKIPPSIGDVALQLQHLCIINEGVKLQAFSSLKKLTNLVSLELVGCELERIPSAVFSLNNLQELDLKDNKLTTVEEILSLQHCCRLVTLRLWHNKITYIPDHISKLHSLEKLDVSWNRLRKLPSRLFYCTKLRHLDVSHNQLTSLPPEVGILQSLQSFSAAFNSLETLPEELFSCKRLKTLILGNNGLSYFSSRVANLVRLVRLDIKGNRLESLPLEIGDCPLLTHGGLIVEESLLDLLPSDVKNKLTNG
ncbi:Volume-regulated anion channel subunit LRRC8E Leucine-rich repeat-containing protein 8E [Channa argus]|uniref:Volume-regulated anion channel subunit LRRC8E Leucine-rich repeat-containing protein 8E n=1 Tax=Channa argus TaxID=215402 RepID=A0A6G1PB83_CHAAH|nr:Volume-regulated anion channel subunit LRRC8E Leucine-rich repeat-containing protein 8E [Channa argus]